MNKAQHDQEWLHGDPVVADDEQRIDGDEALVGVIEDGVPTTSCIASRSVFDEKRNTSFRSNRA